MKEFALFDTSVPSYCLNSEDLARSLAILEVSGVGSQNSHLLMGELGGVLTQYSHYNCEQYILMSSREVL